MSLIDLTYFTGEILVAQRSQPEVQEDLTRLIAKYESKVLTDLFGRQMYAEFVAGTAADPPVQKWVNLKNGVPGEWMGLVNNAKLSPVANYVYCMYVRKEDTQTVGVGEVLPQTDNAKRVSAIEKYVRAWNEMADWFCMLHAYILDHASDYPDYRYIGRPDICKRCRHMDPCGCKRETPEILSYQNTFGI